MKTFCHSVLKHVALSLLLIAGMNLTARAQDARLQLTAKFFGNEPDEKEIKAVISGLKGIYVKNFEFEKEGEYTTADVDSIRSQLRGSAWTKIVGVVSKREGNIEVYLMMTNGEISGLAVLSVAPKELTVVNIIGPVDIAKLATLEDQFGIPDLGIERPSKSKPKN